MKKNFIVVFLVCLLVVVITVQCGGNAVTPTPANSSSAGSATSAAINPTSSSSYSTSPTQAQASFDGPTLLQERCTSCHSLDRVTNLHLNASQWGRVVDQMIGMGASLTTDERNFLVNYLAQTY
ncbi:MAG TPA: hypothetical protein VMC62_04520 [Longilinea sp.]|nr:hypothetical protein [Longilinea sp.]